MFSNPWTPSFFPSHIFHLTNNRKSIKAEVFIRSQSIVCVRPAHLSSTFQDTWGTLLGFFLLCIDPCTPWFGTLKWSSCALYIRQLRITTLISRPSAVQTRGFYWIICVFVPDFLLARCRFSFLGRLFLFKGRTGTYKLFLLISTVSCQNSRSFRRTLLASS